MMHSLGFYNEQSRWDRDEFITVNWENIRPGYESQFRKLSRGTAKPSGLEYDYCSIMHYGDGAWAKKKGLKTLTPKKPITCTGPGSKAEIGKSTTLTELDIKKINKLYDCDSKI